MKTSSIFKKDKLGGLFIVKKVLMIILGMATYPAIFIINRLHVVGDHYLYDLPKTNVLFLSNHQTYFADVIAMHHIFSKLHWHKFLKKIYFLSCLTPRTKTYYIAAEETMRETGLLPKVFGYLGAITVKRHWRYHNKNIQRNADIHAPEKIKIGLSQGWVINFPQGTTRPFTPVQKGTAHIIKNFNPIVVIVYIDGFRRAFDKRGLFYKKKGTKLKVKFEQPVVFKEEQSIEEIIHFISSKITNSPLHENRGSKKI